MINAAALREVQSPLKKRYEAHPETAVITLRAAGRLSDDNVACSLETGRALVEAGLHPATGGDAGLACSGDMLLQALVACAGVTVRAVAASSGIDVAGSVRAEGVLDVRGTLGLAPDVPVGFRSIHLVFDLASSAGPDELDRLIATTERYCVVLQTLTRSNPVEVTRTR